MNVRIPFPKLPVEALLVGLLFLGTGLFSVVYGARTWLPPLTSRHRLTVSGARAERPSMAALEDETHGFFGLARKAPRSAKVIAATSLFLWLGVIYFGRMIMYVDVLYTQF